MAAQARNDAFRQLLLLEERVRRCAPSLPRTVDYREHWPGIRLGIGGADYVVRIDDIAEILEKRSPTRIPGCAPWLKGVLNLRGRMLPVYGLAEYFGYAGAQHRAAREILVVDGATLFCGIVVDAIHGMEKFYQDEFRRAESGQLDGLGALAPYVRFVNQVGEKLCHRLDIEALALDLIASNPSARQQGEDAKRPEPIHG